MRSLQIPATERKSCLPALQMASKSSGTHLDDAHRELAARRTPFPYEEALSQNAPPATTNYEVVPITDFVDTTCSHNAKDHFSDLGRCGEMRRVACDRERSQEPVVVHTTNIILYSVAGKGRKVGKGRKNFLEALILR
jgi:hypothetical protein